MWTERLKIYDSLWRQGKSESNNGKRSSQMTIGVSHTVWGNGNPAVIMPSPRRGNSCVSFHSNISCSFSRAIFSSRFKIGLQFCAKTKEIFLFCKMSSQNMGTERLLRTMKWTDHLQLVSRWEWVEIYLHGSIYLYEVAFNYKQEIYSYR